MLFLAGGITDCPDWQGEIVEHLEAMELPLVVCNPRRNDFPINDPTAAPEQIEWEHTMLEKADFISFWFPKATLCPITLFELGKHLHSEPLIGIEDGYQRSLDIRIQTELDGPREFPIVSTVEDLAFQIQEKIWEFMR